MRRWAVWIAAVIILALLNGIVWTLGSWQESEDSMKTNDLWVSKGGKGKTMYLVLSVFRNRNRLTISYPGKNPKDPDRFKRATTEKGLQRFAEKLEELFERYVRA